MNTRQKWLVGALWAISAALFATGCWLNKGEVALKLSIPTVAGWTREADFLIQQTGNYVIELREEHLPPSVRKKSLSLPYRDLQLAVTQNGQTVAFKFPSSPTLPHGNSTIATSGSRLWPQNSASSIGRGRLDSGAAPQYLASFHAHADLRYQIRCSIVSSGDEGSDTSPRTLVVRIASSDVEGRRFISAILIAFAVALTVFASVATLWHHTGLKKESKRGRS